MRYGSLTYNACSCISHWLVQRHAGAGDAPESFMADGYFIVRGK